jgi:hypothetical protein
LGTLVLEGPARASGSWACVLPVGSFDREAAGPDFGPPKCPDMHMGKRGSRKEAAVRSRAPLGGSLRVRHRLCRGWMERRLVCSGACPVAGLSVSDPCVPPVRVDICPLLGSLDGEAGVAEAGRPMWPDMNMGKGSDRDGVSLASTPNDKARPIGRVSQPACLFSEGSGACVGACMEWAAFCPWPMLAGLWVGSGVTRCPILSGVGGSMASGQESAKVVGNPSKASDLGPCLSAVPLVDGWMEQDVFVPPLSASSEGSRGRSDQASPVAPLSRPARRGRLPLVTKLRRPTDGRPMAGRG